MRDLRLDFIGIGAARYATTWLSDRLREHPNICVSRRKEPHYYAYSTLTSRSNYEMGQQWYASNFSHCSSESIIGEMSTSYLAATESPLLISMHHPNVKLLVSVRNPVDALYSHYHHISCLYPFPNTFERFLQENPRFLTYYRYASHLQHFLHFFPRSHLHVVLFDDIRSQPERVLGEVFAYLGVPEFVSKNVFTRSNDETIVRSRSVHLVLATAKKLLDKNTFTRRLYRRLRFDEFGSYLRELNTTRRIRPTMRAETRHFLLDLYRGEIQQLSRIIERDLDQWNQYSTRKPVNPAPELNSKEIDSRCR